MKSNAITIFMILVVLAGVSYMIFGDSKNMNINILSNQKEQEKSFQFIEVSTWPIGSEKMVAVLEVSKDGNYIEFDNVPTIVATNKEHLNNVKVANNVELGVILPNEIKSYDDVKMFMNSLTRNVTFIVVFNAVSVDVVKYADNNNKFVIVLKDYHNRTKLQIATVKVDGVRIMTPIIVSPYYYVTSEEYIPEMKAHVYNRIFNSSSTFVLVAFNSDVPQTQSMNEVFEMIRMGAKTFNPETYQKPSWILKYIKETNILSSIIKNTQEISVEDNKIIVTISIPKWEKLLTLKVYKKIDLHKIDIEEDIDGSEATLKDINIISNGRETSYVTKLDKSNTILLYPSIDLENVIIKLTYNVEK